jgi:nucleoside-diphosphate-sugar epimerase
MADEVMAAHRRGEIQATVLRSSDYYGPGVLKSALGERVFGNLVAGKKAQLNGSAEMPHSWAYIEDVGRAAAFLGTRDNVLGQVWIAPHASAHTQKEMVDMAGSFLGHQPGCAVISPLMMRLAGLFVPDARASVEMMYQFTQPFVVASNRVQQVFGLEPTPVETGIERTVRWYKERIGGKK